MSEIQSIETETKALSTTFEGIPDDILSAMMDGKSHPGILARGPVEQIYLEVSRENLRRVISLVNEAGLPFGHPGQQAYFEDPDAVREIRVLKKRDLNTEENITQVTIKGKKTTRLSVGQLETNEEDSQFAERVANQLLKEMNSEGKVTKVWHTFVDDAGGTEIEVEHDIFTSHQDKNYGSLMVAETEAHGSDQLASEAALKALIPNLPSYFTIDANDIDELKSAKLAVTSFQDLPKEIRRSVEGMAEKTREIQFQILNGFPTL